MASSTSLPLLLLLVLPLNLSLSHATTFDIINQCPYTVWAAAVPGGGRQLDRGKNWTLDVESSTPNGRIWARTGCSFDSSGHGHCDTGDCGGLLACRSPGSPPNTNAEFSLNQYDGMDFFDISLINGFNVPMEFGPKSGSCRGIRCSADIVGRCPDRLKAPGGCHNPCTVFKTDQYCCSSARCGPTNYSQFFKRNCPTSYSFPFDDLTNSFTCPGGTNYKVVFCPQEIGHVSI